jgi:hypothetical protein
LEADLNKPSGITILVVGCRTKYGTFAGSTRSGCWAPADHACPAAGGHESSGKSNDPLRQNGGETIDLDHSDRRSMIFSENRYPLFGIMF